MGGTAIGFLAALAVLLVVFGSFLAAILPLLTAAFALGVGVAVIGLLSHALTMASFSSQLSLLIGLGVGVDYALFIVTRYRQEIMRGARPPRMRRSTRSTPPAARSCLPASRSASRCWACSRWACRSSTAWRRPHRSWWPSPCSPR